MPMRVARGDMCRDWETTNMNADMTGEMAKTSVYGMVLYCGGAAKYR
jgi:hypothetical protein